MKLDPSFCYKAVRARDARFDGRFFTGVSTTRVYCRPICPARTPRAEHCRFFACAAAAQAAGFRPCLRCRPEASPGTPAWQGAGATVSRALRLIDAGALDTDGLDALAARLGVGARHLRRLFLRHLGAAPLAVAQTRRALFAKKLLDETALPLAEVAQAAGFASLRRFNATLRATYGRPPRALRRARLGGALSAPPGDITLRLPFRPPYPWNAIARFLAARATPGVESAGPGGYRRSVSIDGRHGLVEVRPVEGQNHLLARIRLAGSGPDLARIADRLRCLFDLGADPQEIGADLGRDPLLRVRLRALAGVRVPGAWDGFELAVRVILGQEVSVAAATTFAGRLAAAYGEPLVFEDPTGGAPEQAIGRLFPTPDALAGADLTRFGLPRARAAAICALAAATARKEIALEPGGDPDETLRRLRALPGIGEWTAQLVAMRALREPDAFPATDLGLRRAVAAGTSPWPATRLVQAAEVWRPWRAYAAVALWWTDAGPASKRRITRGAS